MTPGKQDVSVVRRHLLAMDVAIRNLRRHQAVSMAEMQADPDLRWAIERGLQLLAQNALDIATHVAAAAGFDSSDYATAIDRLVTIGALTSEFAAGFRGIAGFRNVLVHGYLEVDLSLVQQVLRDKLPDFDAFARSIERHLGMN